MQDTFANIIAGVIQIIPLIAVPFILKGVIDGVPVLGNALQKGFNKTFSAADKGQKALGIGAVRRAQVLNGERNVLGLRNRSGKSTMIENFGNRRSARDSRVKAIGAGRDARFKSAIADADPKADVSIFNRAGVAAQQGRIAHDQEENAEFFNKRSSAKLEAHTKKEVSDPNSTLGQLDLQRRAFSDVAATADAKTEKVWEEARTKPQEPQSDASRALTGSLRQAGISRDDLVRRAHEQTGYGQAKNFATNQRAGDFSSILSNTVDRRGSASDQSLLEIAGGTVNAVSGIKRAQASAVEAGFKIYDQNTAADRALLSKRMSDRQLEITKSTRKNQKGEALDANDKVIRGTNTILEDAMRTGDSNEVMAARDLYMSQGSSGVESAFRTIMALEEDKTLGENGAFTGREDILNTLKRTQLSEHGQASKGTATTLVKWAQGGGSLRAAAQDTGRYTALTDSELGKQSTASLIRGVANGGITTERAAAILSDDTLRKDYDEQQRQVLQLLKDHGQEAVTAIYNPDNGKEWTNQKQRDDWATATLTAKKELNNEARGRDEYAVNDEDVRVVDIEPVVPAKLPVPPAGSPTPVLMDYVDKVGGVNRTAKGSFVKLQESVRNAPDKSDDNDDLEKLITQMDIDSSRRNREADTINEKSRNSMGKDLIQDDQKYTYIVGPQEPASAPTPSTSQTLNPSTLRQFIDNRSGGIRGFNSADLRLIRSAAERINQPDDPTIQQILRDLDEEEQRQGTE